MCVEAQPEKATPKKFKSPVLRSECSYEIKMPASINLRTVSLVPPRSKVT